MRNSETGALQRLLDDDLIRSHRRRKVENIGGGGQGLEFWGGGGARGGQIPSRHMTS